MDGGAAVRKLICFIVALVAAAATAFELTWTSVDGGGTTWSRGGGFTLGATIGQPDAGPAAGGGFHLQGGFWSAVSDEPGWTVPALRIAIAVGQPHVYWPAGATNWVLKLSPDPRVPVWGLDTNQPVLIGSEWRVPAGTATGAVYRLEMIP